MTGALHRAAFSVIWRAVRPNWYSSYLLGRVLTYENLICLLNLQFNLCMRRMKNVKLTKK